MRRTLTLAVAALLTLTNVLFAQAAPRKDLQVVHDISKQVLGYPQFTVFDDISAQIEQGTVTLDGRVTMPYKLKDIQDRVAKVPGVTQVRNRIRVLPVSIYDDDLRYRIARAIYGNPSFWQYAAMVNPPIHVIVENGHVTLTGVVNSNVERVLARSLATRFGAFSVENELKTDAEAQAAMEKMQ